MTNFYIFSRSFNLFLCYPIYVYFRQFLNFEKKLFPKCAQFVRFSAMFKGEPQLKNNLYIQGQQKSRYGRFSQFLLNLFVWKLHQPFYFNQNPLHLVAYTTAIFITNTVVQQICINAYYSEICTIFNHSAIQSSSQSERCAKIRLSIISNTWQRTKCFTVILI